MWRSRSATPPDLPVSMPSHSMAPSSLLDTSTLSRTVRWHNGTRIGSPVGAASASYFGQAASPNRGLPISATVGDFFVSPLVLGGGGEFEQAATPRQSGTNSARRSSG